jgi:hypothetical protein
MTSLTYSWCGGKVWGPILEIYLWPPGSALYSTTAGRHNLNSCTHLSNMGHPRLAAHLVPP